MKKAMEKKFNHGITAGTLLLLMVLSIIFATGVFAANEEAAKTTATEIGVAYRGHVQNQGNMPKPEGTMVAGPEALGTRGESLRVEGFWIQLTGDVPEGANIVYEVHVQNEGWMTPEKNGIFAGTAGESQRVEAIKISLENLPGYDVYYRGHVQNVGDIPQVDGEWGWKKNGEELGTTGSCLRLEELQVKIVKQPDTTIAYNKAGTYGPITGVEVIENDVSIDTPDVVLQNLHIKGNLIIGEGVGEGDVTLNNIIVEGETYIRGGGKNSIHINGGDYNKITIQQTSSGQVRIVATNAEGLEVVVSEAAKGEDIILEGAFENVQIDAPDVKISTQGDTTIKDMVVGKSSTGAEITLDKDTTVNKIDLNASVDMKGEGTIEQANVNSDDVTFEQKPVEETVAPEVKVPPVVTPPTPPEPTPTGPSTEALRAVEVKQSMNILTATPSPVAATVSYQWQKSDTATGTYNDIPGATSSTYQVASSDIGKYIRVTAVGKGGYYYGTVTSAAVPLKTMSVTANNKTAVIVDKTLQINATILPADLADKSITWSISNLDGTETNKATISDTGLLTGNETGTVYVTAINYANELFGGIEIKVVTADQAVELDSIAAYTNSLTVDAYNSTFYVNYAGIDESQKSGLAGYYSDAIIQLDRVLADDEKIIVNAFNRDIEVTNKVVSGQEIKLSTLLGLTTLGPDQLSAAQQGSFDISIKDANLTAGLQVIVTPIITKAAIDTRIEGKTSGLYIHTKAMKAYFDSINVDAWDSKFMVNYAGGLAADVVNSLNGYSSDVEIYLTRELQDGEKIKVNGKTITNADMAKGVVGRIINLSALLDSTANAAINTTRPYEIKIEDVSLNSGLYVIATPLLTKNDDKTDVVRNNFGTGLDIYTEGMKAYAKSLTFAADNTAQKFTVTYDGLTTKTGLTGYYADVMLYLERPMVTGESFTLTGFGKADVIVTKETLLELGITDQWINLSKLMDLPLNNDNLAVNKKGTYELTVGNTENLKTNLGLSISPVLTTSDYTNTYLNNIDPSEYIGANIQIAAGDDQAAPTGLTGVAPTILGGTGKITGTTSAMEYRSQYNYYWTEVTGTEITALIAGTYEVRYAGDPAKGLNAGESVQVVVPEFTQDENKYRMTGIVDGKQPGVPEAVPTVATEKNTYLEADATRFNAENYPRIAITDFTKTEGSVPTDTPVVIRVNGENLAGLHLFGFAAKSSPTDNDAWWDIVNGGWGDGSMAPMTIDQAIAAINSGTIGNFYAVGSPGTYTFKLQMIDAVMGIKVLAETEALTVTIGADQSPPVGLTGLTPTTSANTDGMIINTTELMEYKLQTADESAYLPCTNTTTMVAAPGTYLVRNAAQPESLAGATAEVTVSPWDDATDVAADYQGFVDVPEADWLLDRGMLETPKEDFSFDAIQVNLVNAPANAKIYYRTYNGSDDHNDLGWTAYVSDGGTAGSDNPDGIKHPIEAIKLKLENMTDYSVIYQVYVKNIGWMSWVRDNEMAGTSGQNLPIEAIRIRIVKVP